MTDDPQMQAAMESCPAKTVIAGGMGFALGGAFGLFMSSVRLSPDLPCDAMELTRKSDGADELRYASDRARPAARGSAAERTTAEGFQGYGQSIVQLGEELCVGWGNIFWDGVLYRRGMYAHRETVPKADFGPATVPGEE